MEDRGDPSRWDAKTKWEFLRPPPRPKLRQDSRRGPADPQLFLALLAARQATDAACPKCFKKGKAALERTLLAWFTK